ncbi:MAG: glycosyltransferase family 4 protein [Thermoanaerobaculia bacterium]
MPIPSSTSPHGQAEGSLPLRVLMMADTPADPNRGAAGTEVQTIDALRRLGHQVDALWSSHLGRRIAHGNLHLLLELPRAYERAVVRSLHEKRYDVIHVNQPQGYRAARAVHRLSPASVFIHRSHGFEPNVEETLKPWRALYDCDNRHFLRRLSSRGLTSLVARHGRAIAREADGHIVSSSLDAAFLNTVFDVALDRVAVIPQSAPESYLSGIPPAWEVQRLHRVLHVAQLAFFKAPMITAAAFNHLAEADHQLRFTWVCDRSSESTVRSLLTPQANERMEVLAWTEQNTLRDIYDAHGIFLFPSFFEGFGKAFLEAMSRGLCVIASDTGGMHDMIENGHDGVLVPLGDAKALAEAALAIIRNPERAAVMSASAVATARRHTWDRVASETAEFYRARLTARNAVRR